MAGLTHVPSAAAGIYTVLPMTAAAVSVWGFGELFGALHATAFALAVGRLAITTQAA